MKRKVLHPITRLIIGGAQENTMLTADYLDRNLWQVDILSGPQTGSEGSIIDEVCRRKISLFLEHSLVREIHPLKDMIALFRLARFMKKHQYDIVHTHSSKAGIIGRWAAWVAGVPVIIHTVHGWGHHDHQHPWVRKVYISLEKLSLKITDKLVAVSGKNILKGLSDGIGQKNNYTVIRSGIELERFGHPHVDQSTMRKQLNIPSDAIVIGTVMRLSPQKAPLDFIEAATILAQKLKKVYFVLVGDGPLHDAVVKKAQENNIEKQFIMTGLRRDIPELMNCFDIFVLPSLWEGLPRVIPQAMASGVPVIATKIDGSAEIIQSELNGVLVAPGKPHDMADAVMRVLQDSAFRNRIIRAALETTKEYSAQKMVERIETMYLELLNINMTKKIKESV